MADFAKAIEIAPKDEMEEIFPVGPGFRHAKANSREVSRIWERRPNSNPTIRWRDHCESLPRLDWGIGAERRWRILTVVLQKDLQLMRRPMTQRGFVFRSQKKYDEAIADYYNKLGDQTRSLRLRQPGLTRT